MKKLAVFVLALTGWASAQTHWSASDWHRHENNRNPHIESKAYYLQRNGWEEHRSDVHYDSNGNGVVVPYSEQDFPRPRVNWRDYDSNRDGRLSEDELRWMERDAQGRK